MVDVVQRYGISLRTADGQMRSSFDVLGDVAEAVQNAGSATEQATIAADAFGSRIGLRLLPLLQQGREGLLQMAEAAQRVGLVLGDQFIKQADAASDSIATMQFAIQKGFQIGLVEELAGSVEVTEENLKAATETGVRFGRVVGIAFRGLIASARFVADHFAAFAAVVAGLVAIPLASFLIGVARTAIEVAKAIRLIVAGQVAWNAASKGLLGIAQGVLAAAAAIAAYTAVNSALADDAEKLTQQLDALSAQIGFVDDAAQGAASSTGQMATSLEAALDQAQRENEQLTALRDAWRGYGSTVQTVQRTIEIDNQLRAARISRLEAEESGLLAVLVANQKLRAEIGLFEDAERQRDENTAQQVAQQQSVWQSAMVEPEPVVQHESVHRFKGVFHNVDR
jgi:hypothetical protein